MLYLQTGFGIEESTQQEDMIHPKNEMQPKWHQTSQGQKAKHNWAEGYRQLQWQPNGTKDHLGPGHFQKMKKMFVKMCTEITRVG